VRDGLTEVFQQTYRELRPRSEVPDLRAEFFSFANVNSTIRLREGKLLVRVSDLLEGAPEYVLRAIAHILLAKMFRKPVDREHASRYRRYVSSQHMSRKAHLVRQIRGRKRIGPARGRVYHPRVPTCAIEYIVYHEMLHLKHPVRLRGSRRCVHSAEFQAEEREFPQLDSAKKFLAIL
jgi:hypothetical protein